MNKKVKALLASLTFLAAACTAVSAGASGADVTLKNVAFMKGTQEIYTASAGDITPSLTVESGGAENAVIISASYDGNKLTDVGYKPVTLAAGTGTYNGKAVNVAAPTAETKAAVMLWSADLKALSKKIELTAVSRDARIMAMTADISDAQYDDKTLTTASDDRAVVNQETGVISLYIQTDVNSILNGTAKKYISTSDAVTAKKTAFTPSAVEMAEGASCAAATESKNLDTNNIYSVTAADGTVKDYTVEIIPTTIAYTQSFNDASTYRDTTNVAYERYYMPSASNCVGNGMWIKDKNTDSEKVYSVFQKFGDDTFLSLRKADTTKTGGTYVRFNYGEKWGETTRTDKQTTDFYTPVQGSYVCITDFDVFIPNGAIPVGYDEATNSTLARPYFISTGGLPANQSFVIAPFNRYASDGTTRDVRTSVAPEIALGNHGSARFDLLSRASEKSGKWVAHKTLECNQKYNIGLVTRVNYNSTAKTYSFVMDLYVDGVYVGTENTQSTTAQYESDLGIAMNKLNIEWLGASTTDPICLGSLRTQFYTIG